MRKIVLLSLTGIISLANAAANQDLYINLGKNEAQYDFAKLQKLTFADNQLVVTANGKATSHKLEDVKFMKFGESTVATNANALQVSGVKMTTQGPILQISGLNTPAKIRVYNLQGNLLHSFNATAAVSYDMSALKSGVYICKVQGAGLNFSQTIVRR